MNSSDFDSANLRKRAEAQLAEINLSSSAHALDPRRVLHELQVHQIELELQNEELMATNRELEALRHRFETLFEHAPVGYLTLALDSTVLSANQHAFSLLKRDPQSLVGSKFKDCFAPQSVQAFAVLLASSTHGSADMIGDNLLVHRPHSVPIYIKAQCSQVDFSDAQGRVVLVAIMDTSALKFAMDDVVSRLTAS